MITYLPLYNTPVLPSAIFSKQSTRVTYNGRKLTKIALRLFAGYYPLYLVFFSDFSCVGLFIIVHCVPKKRHWCCPL